ncbi:uncharacterized protein MONBRDRAFT_38880 [Monosiga brevicollis MX1]|uniref:Uncharacterized protein n=1 Tax=Monosiga brevicollis TaxID=81824 RepID=A9VAS2_MONBE|nr:uncharacterized protein MONBRDRAFT_38880 [Monosiga brevicollis MX1]EDQ85425.1 predicted protein [Monosiga brevicollis MX1]|eukprot:XP_001749836.1 hypothetical protein [Monosiga brevicollis MX1]
MGAFNLGSKKKSEQVRQERRQRTRVMKRQQQAAKAKAEPNDATLAQQNRSNPKSHARTSNKRARKMKTRTINELRAHGAEVIREDKDKGAIVMARNTRDQRIVWAETIRAIDERQPFARPGGTTLGAPTTFTSA